MILKVQIDGEKWLQHLLTWTDVTEIAYTRQTDAEAMQDYSCVAIFVQESHKTLIKLPDSFLF